jgi:hypothetical protein
MRMKTLLLSVSTAGMLLGGAFAFAQQPGMPMDRQGPMGGGPGGMMGGGGGGMMGDGGMMNKMGQCERMMGARGGHAMPQLPAGNEKLQLQMHAEMMQRMGEVLAKYAAQIK